MRGLVEEARAPDQKVRTEDVLHGIDDCRVADHVGEPGKQQMRFLIGASRQHAALCRHDRVEPLAAERDVIDAEGRDRKQVSVAAISLDLGIRQLAQHDGLH